jgi:hypothetical protein
MGAGEIVETSTRYVIYVKKDFKCHFLPFLLRMHQYLGGEAGLPGCRLVLVLVDCA